MCKRLIKRFLYGSVPGFRGRFPYFGENVYFPRQSAIFKIACEHGVYEHDNVKLLARLASLAPAGAVVLDVGANIGLMALPVLYSCPNCKVVSFEPSPQTYRYLERTVSESNYKDRWRVVDKALCAQSGTVKFFSGEPCVGAFDGLADTNRGGSKNTVEVVGSTLDEEWKALGEPLISVIKLDVEGAEMRVLKGAVRCISAQRPYVLLEWNSVNLRAFGHTQQDLLKYAVQCGYTVLSVPSLVPIKACSQLDLHMAYTESFLLSPW